MRTVQHDAYIANLQSIVDHLDKKLEAAKFWEQVLIEEEW